MGEAKRRKALWGKAGISAVHEAGHALADYVTRRAWGCAEPLHSIDMGNARWRQPNGDIWVVGATTYAPMFPSEMQETLTREERVALVQGDRAIFFQTVVGRSLAAGLDVERWARDFILGGVAGPVAEAVYLRRKIADVLQGDNCAHDVEGITEAFKAWKGTSGTQGHEEFAIVLNEELNRAYELVQRNQKAISALANALPREGSFPGAQASEILAANLAKEDHHGSVEG